MYRQQLLPKFGVDCLFMSPLPFHLTHQRHSVVSNHPSLRYPPSSLTFFSQFNSSSRQRFWFSVSLFRLAFTIIWELFAHPLSPMSPPIILHQADYLSFVLTTIFSPSLQSSSWEIIWNHLMGKSSIPKISLTCLFVFLALRILSSGPITQPGCSSASPDRARVPFSHSFFSTHPIFQFVPPPVFSINCIFSVNDTSIYLIVFKIIFDTFLFLQSID